MKNQSETASDREAVVADRKVSDLSTAHDPVIAALLSRGTIRASAVTDCVVASGQSVPSWRDLVGVDGVDREAMFAEVANQAQIPRQEIDAYSPPDDLVRSILGLFDEDISSGVLLAGLLPVEILTDPALADFTIALATHDPLRHVSGTMLQELGVTVVLRYAPEDVVRERILSLGIVSEAELDKARDDAEQELAEAGTHTAPRSGDLPAIDPGVARWLDEGEGASAEVAGLVRSDVDAAQSDVQSTSDSSDQGDPGPPDPTALPRAAETTETTGTASPTTQARRGSRPTISSDKYDIEKLQGALRDRVVGMLVHKEVVTQEQVLGALEAQKANPRDVLWRLLANTKGVNRDAVFREAAELYAFRSAELTERDAKFAKLVMESFSEAKRDELLRMRVFPIEYEADTATGGAKLVFVTHDPARPEIQRILHQLNVGRFQLYYAPESYVTDLIQEAFPRRNEFLDRMTDDPMSMDFGASFEEEGELIDESALEAEISRSSLINLFEATLLEATRKGASDIHVFPNAQRKVEIHFRIDGRLQKWHVEDKIHPEAFLAVVKDNSRNVDRFERDAAQDGFIQRRIDDALIRYRVSVLPIATAVQEIRAESIVIRVLDDRKVVTDLARLGMLDVALDRFNQAIRQPHGMVILTGPTGSGKSTTLVAALYRVVSPEINVLTVEDPVEYIISGVRQIKLNHKLDLEQAMRAILRHDPDVVMVGEMRDKPTADLAIKLANTGHLAFSTLHTNDAPSAISRLYKMGVEPFLLATAINLVVAQRLIRSLCPTCKVIDEDVDKVLARQVGFSDKELKETTFYTVGRAGRKCQSCRGTGYKGRRALCETLFFSRAIRHLILESAEKIDEDAIREQGRKEGMLTLQDSAREIVKMGDTSLDELIRVTAVE